MSPSTAAEGDVGGGPPCGEVRPRGIRARRGRVCHGAGQGRLEDVKTLTLGPHGGEQGARSVAPSASATPSVRPRTWRLAVATSRRSRSISAARPSDARLLARKVRGRKVNAMSTSDPSKPPKRRASTGEEREEGIGLGEWVLDAEASGLLCLSVLVLSVERGDAKLPIEPQAWENTLTALEWSLGKHLEGVVQSATHYVPADLERLRRVHVLGTEAIAGGQRDPALGPLTDTCLSLIMSNWRTISSKLPVCYPPPEGHGDESERGTLGPP